MIEDEKIIGHIMFSKAELVLDDGRHIPSWTFGPISIHPDYQRKGYGLKLLNHSLEKAREHGVGFVCMEGNIDFYKHAGFILASHFGIHYHTEPRESEVPFFLAKELIHDWLHEHGVDADVIMGSRTKDLLFYIDEMKAVAKNVYVTTDDGSFGFHGMGTNQLQALYDEGIRYDHCVAIGPMIMMKFVCLLTKELEIPTIVSMNPIMVDGTGMCGACRLMVGDQVKFACVDGPEFDGHLVDFDGAMKRVQQYKTEEGRAMLRLQEGDTHKGNCGNC